ncbi:MAG: glycosyltransferase family 4 protein [Phycisphaerales bacterium]
MTSVAMLTSTAFWRRSRGSERRIADLTRAIARAGHAVTVIWAGRLSPQDQALLAHEPVSLEQTGTPLPTPGANAPLGAFADDEFHEALAGAIARTRPDTLIAQYIRFAPAVAALPAHLRPPECMVDTHDVMHTRARAFHAAGHDHWIDLTRDEEAAALGVFDLTLAINDADAAVLHELTSRVLLVPHAIEPIAPADPPTGAPNALFVGASGVPNVDAARWLIEDIWPAARRDLPGGATLTVAGSVADAIPIEFLSAHGVRSIGFVDDLGPIYASATVTVAPLRFGGGLKIKNLESLAHAVPVVTTPVGAQGMESAAGSSVLIGCDTATLAAALVRACNDAELNRSMRSAANVFVADRFAPDVAYRPLLRMLRTTRGAAA